MTRTNKTATREIKGSRRGTNEVVSFKIKRNNTENEGIGLGAQQVSLKDSKLVYSPKGTELIKLTLQNIATEVEEVFNFINGRNEIMRVMDVLDPTGEDEINFDDYIDTEFMVEVVKTTEGFKNVIDAWDIPNHAVAIAATEEEDEDDEDDYEDEDDVYEYEYEEIGGEGDEESEINKIFVD